MNKPNPKKCRVLLLEKTAMPKILHNHCDATIQIWLEPVVFQVRTVFSTSARAFVAFGRVNEAKLELVYSFTDRCTYFSTLLNSLQQLKQTE